ncbi:MAG: MATE family efflux transporter, partial [Eubacterium sp.]|nr:MATE family efflux transporter [Eubacterium sp.]
LKMALPVVMGMMVQVLYNLVDTFFIGMLGDENQLAGASITTPILMIEMAVATIVSTGAASYISRCIGKKDKDEAHRTLATGVVICVILALILMVVGIIGIKPLVVGLGASENVYPFARTYVFIMLLGAVPVMLNYAGGQLLRSEGAMVPSMIGMLIGTVINLALDPLFIFVFKMGIGGAALATVLGNLGAMLYYGYYYMSGKSFLKLDLRNFSRKPIIWKEIFTIGIPACLSQGLMSVALIILNNLVGNDDILKAGMGISSKLIFIGTFVFMGFAAGCQPLVGYNYGAGNYDRVKKIFKTGMGITFGVGVALFAVFWLAAPAMVGLFTPLDNVRDAGVLVFRISIFCFLVLGPQMQASVGIQALGKAKQSLILSISRQGLIYVPLMFLMKAAAGFEGLIWAQPIADAITLCIGVLFLVSIMKKTTAEAAVPPKAG